VSLIANSHQQGASLFSSRPHAGFGNIQPAVREKRDRVLVA
jgi:hypothetical protein